MSTFLGAHAVGRQYSHEQYVSLVVDEMIPEVGRQHLADYIDVFCDKGFFTPEDTSRILEAGAQWGMIPKIHADFFITQPIPSVSFIPYAYTSPVVRRVFLRGKEIL